MKPGERYRIITGSAESVLPTLRDKSIDFVFTDPCYGHNNNNGDLISNWEAALGGDAQPARPIMNDGPIASGVFNLAVYHFARLLRVGCCCCCCCGGGGGPDPMFARWSTHLDSVLDFVQMVVWDKGPMGMGWHYRRSYETVLVAKKPGGKMRWYDNSHRVENIIRFGASGIRKILPRAHHHPTQKPVELAAHFIRLHTRPGDLVLDPFCGSGSTGVAALQLARRFIGIDVDPRWTRMARRNCRQAKPN